MAPSIQVPLSTDAKQFITFDIKSNQSVLKKTKERMFSHSKGAKSLSRTKYKAENF